MSSEKRTKIPKYGYADLDSGIADIVVELNKKGYLTKCSCEGHLYEYTNKSWNYNYSPIWLDFKNEACMPPYPPQIEGYTYKRTKPWYDKHSGWYMGEYSPLKGCIQYGLWVGFSFYKREIKTRGDIHKEHERVLKEVLKWAQGLPTKEDYQED